MLTVLIVWVITSFILLSFGDIFILLYNTLFKRRERYNLPDTFMIGIIFITILLSMTSFFLPSNHYMLAAYLVISTTFWLFNTKRLLIRFEETKKSFLKLSPKNIIVLMLFILSFLTYILWSEKIFDSIFYHYQNIRWNEEYPITPGIGNLKDHLAFNSNYFLISAIFTFRFLFHEPVYLFQDILFTFVIGWVCLEAINSKFRLDRIILLILLFIFFSMNSDGLTDSSTDIIPNICVFYYISRFVLYPKHLTKKLLLAILLPVTLITFKLSVFPLCLISLYLFFYIIKKKNYPLTFFYAFVPFLIVALWMARNIIVSGYLVYPVYQIDLFDVDWKVPKAVAEWQYNYIFSYAKERFDELYTFNLFSYNNNIYSFKILFVHAIFLDLFYLVISLSPILIIFSILKKKSIDKNIYIIYFATFLVLCYWFMSAPDFRFALGSILGMIFLISYMILSIKNKESVCIPKTGSRIFLAISVLVLCLSINRTVNFTKFLTLIPASDERPPLYIVLYEPYSSKYQIKVKDISTEFSEYKSNGVCIYVSEDVAGRSFDKIPCMNKFIYTDELKNTEIIEARGKSIYNGFRVKEEYIEKIFTALKSQ